MLVYLDTSAAAKLLVEEDESTAVSSHLDGRAAGHCSRARVHWD